MGAPIAFFACGSMSCMVGPSWHLLPTPVRVQDESRGHAWGSRSRVTRSQASHLPIILAPPPSRVTPNETSGDARVIGEPLCRIRGFLHLLS
eukprot:scaffold1816_cov134-Isochrysis_galbana.AAC.1